jgi:thiol-disulfide isomerase/thioredoxin
MWLLCLTSSGCSLFSKKGGSADRSAAARQPAEKDRVPPDPSPVIPTSAETRELEGILAGQVVDAFNRHPNEAVIRWVCLDDPKDKAAENDRIAVAVSPEGYFTIQGLKRGKHYKLIATAKNGDRKLAGVTFTEAPNIRVLIKISEDFVTKDTPDLPGAPVVPGKGKPSETPKSKESSQLKSEGGGAQNPKWEAGDGAGKSKIVVSNPEMPNVQLPAKPEQPPNQDQKPKAPPSLEHTADNIQAQAKNKDTKILIPSWKPNQPQTNKEIPLVGAAEPETKKSSSLPASVTRVPSCVVVGSQLKNLALYEPSGKTWELSQRKGKLLLLDFWGTQCPPCRTSAPHLRLLQEKYGKDGLEIIGIGYSQAESWPAQVKLIDGVAREMGLRTLLGDGDSWSSVRKQLRVDAFPTFILIDENGWMVWRHPGVLDEETLNDLEFRIKSRLGKR